MRKIWIWVLVLGLCLLLLAGALFMIQYRSYALSMTMLDKPIMAVEVGQTFDDPGAAAESYDWLRGYRDVPVSCTGTVDTAVPGVYKLTYTAEFHGIFCSESREVYVVESLDPVITLHQESGSYTLPGQEYAEEGYTATDWFDGDITHLVQRTEQDGVVTYTVTSSSGRTATAVRNIFYDDPFAPELVLNGGEEITVGAGQSFQDPGFTATDNVDGDLTEQVQVSGQVDIYAPGDYELLYTVTDSWGNTTTAVRKVTVDITMKNPIVPTGKVIYLTFDDGPGPYTNQLLDILAKYNVKATFFVVNSPNISIVKRMAEEGHSIGLHSTNHRYSQIYASEEAFYADMYKLQAIVAEYTGEKTYLVRFPGGSSNTISRRYCEGIMTQLTQSLPENGFRYFDWNVSSSDASSATTAEEVYRNVINGISGKKVSVVLQHDIKDFSVAAVERIIIWALANGYTFLPLTTDSPACAHRVAN